LLGAAGSAAPVFKETAPGEPADLAAEPLSP
jgi:hypothetical protein